MQCRFHEILGDIVKMAMEANEYIDKQAPWTLKKQDPALMGAVLYYLAEGIRCLAIFLQPFMPGATAKILDQLAVPMDQRGFESAYHLGFEGGAMSPSALKPGTSLPAPEPVFPRIADE